MADARFDLRHVGILMGSHAKYAVRGGSGLTFVIVVVVIGLTVAGFLIDPLDHERQRLERVAPVIGYWLDAEPGKPAGGAAAGRDPGSPSEAVESVPQLRFLLRDQPALLSVMFLILLALEPFMMGFGGFNQLSGDIANRGLRYLLLRTGRLNIVLARLLGTLVFSAATSLFTIAVIVAYLAVRYEIYALGDLARWGLLGWGAINVFSLPYLALCTWISTSIGSPFAALAITQLAIGVPIVMVKYAKAMMSARADVSWLDRLTPWGWKFDLLHPDPGKVALAVAVMAGFGVLFALLGTRHFLRRDL